MTGYIRTRPTQETRKAMHTALYGERDLNSNPWDSIYAIAVAAHIAETQRSSSGARSDEPKAGGAPLGSEPANFDARLETAFNDITSRLEIYGIGLPDVGAIVLMSGLRKALASPSAGIGEPAKWIALGAAPRAEALTDDQIIEKFAPPYDYERLRRDWLAGNLLYSAADAAGMVRAAITSSEGKPAGPVMDDPAFAQWKKDMP